MAVVVVAKVVVVVVVVVAIVVGVPVFLVYANLMLIFMDDRALVFLRLCKG